MNKEVEMYKLIWLGIKSKLSKESLEKTDEAKKDFFKVLEKNKDFAFIALADFILELFSYPDNFEKYHDKENEEALEFITGLLEKLQG